MKSAIKLGCRWKRTIYRKNGDIETKEHHNTISTSADDILDKIIDGFQATQSLAFDSLFTTSDEGSDLGSLTTGTDGIAVDDSGAYYAMSCAAGAHGEGITEPTTKSIKVTGWTDRPGTYDNGYLGIDAPGDGSLFGILFATASSWLSVTLVNGDELKVEWTITVS